ERKRLELGDRLLLARWVWRAQQILDVAQIEALGPAPRNIQQALEGGEREQDEREPIGQDRPFGVVRRIGHSRDFIVADPITEQAVGLEQYGGLEQLDQAVDQKRERSCVGGKLEAVAVGLQMRERDRREHQQEAAGEHDFRRKVAPDPDVLLVEWDFGEDLV